MKPASPLTWNDIRRLYRQQGDGALVFLCRVLILFRRLAKPPRLKDLRSDLYVMF